MRIEKNIAKQFQLHQMKHKYMLNMNIFSFVINDIKIIKIKITFLSVTLVKNMHKAIV